MINFADKSGGNSCFPLYTLGLYSIPIWNSALQWHHNGCDSVSNHQPHDCLLNRLFRSRSKKTWKLRVTGLCAGNSSATSEFPAQMARKVGNVSIWWRHHDIQAGQSGRFGSGQRSLANQMRQRLLLWVGWCPIELGHDWFRWWLAVCLIPSQKLNQTKPDSTPVESSKLYFFVWRRHENVCLCTGSNVNTNYGRIASCAGC